LCPEIESRVAVGMFGAVTFFHRFSARGRETGYQRILVHPSPGP
jgi:hypothetical protein